jgi:HAD superfamily hydrolase (TIGR01509 family)
VSEFSLARVLAGPGPLLIDFDGPVCSIFANYPASAVAAELRSLLLESGAEFPGPVTNQSDPLEVLRWTATLHKPVLARAVEDSLRAAELQAAASASPTPYAREVLSTARQTGRQVAIVSNNSTPAIEAYLDAHELSRYVTRVVGREPYHPEKMKPHPQVLFTALAILGCAPSESVLIGDSLADIKASRKVGIRIVAYANKPRKLESFEQTGADAIVTTMAAVAEALLVGE